MTGAESSSAVPPAQERVGKPAPERALPASLEQWVAALSVARSVDQHLYGLVARAYSQGREPEWSFFSSFLVNASMVDPAGSAETYTFRTEWRDVIERALDELGGSAAVRHQLLRVWLADPDRHLLDAVCGWARDLQRWDVLEHVWLLLGEHTSGMSTELIDLFQDLPVEARRSRPILTWASAAAASRLAPSDGRGRDEAWERLLLDSAMLHADWSVRVDTDQGVTAGTFRMLGERRLPGTRAGDALRAAWRTKEEIDAFIDARSRAGLPPGRTSHAIFRAFSARLALFRFDLVSAINEARWALLLADWKPASELAAGVEALATSMAGEEGRADHSSPAVAGMDDGLGVRGLRGMGQLHRILAAGNDALRKLDRDELDRCLALLATESAIVAGVGSVRVALEAWRAMLWGEPALGINTLSARIHLLAMAGREPDEPLGAAMLGRPRLLLLLKRGVFGAAAQATQTMPEQLRLAPRAGVHLWAGEYQQAIRLADAAPYQHGLPMGDRYALTLIGAAATLLEGTADANTRIDAIREVSRLLSHEAFLSIGLLPRPARDALLEVCRPELGATEPAFQLLEERLNQLNDAGESSSQPIRLTDRERVLLPLLATNDSIPDIARHLQVSVNTVRKQVTTLREKFLAGTRGELIRKARTRGIIQ